MITLAIPSKGRLMEQAADVFAKAGMPVDRQGSERGYRGTLQGVNGVEIAFLSASEIAGQLKSGKINAGITGEDLLHETMLLDQAGVNITRRFDFGAANVIVAVPECWLDVARMDDLDDVAAEIYRNHNRRLRVATKYKNLTRRFFASHGVTGYRIVESTGATEGAPAAGTADLIVDITTTGSTLAANRLKILDDGIMLESRAVLAAQQQTLENDTFVRILSAITAI